MESLRSFHDHLGNLQHQARKLTSAGLSLTALFDEEVKQLNREDEALVLGENAARLYGVEA